MYKWLNQPSILKKGNLEIIERILTKFELFYKYTMFGGYREGELWKVCLLYVYWDIDYLWTYLLSQYDIISFLMFCLFSSRHYCNIEQIQ